MNHRENIPTPYVTFPIIGTCQFRCTYCSDGGRGEMSGCSAGHATVEFIEEFAEIAYRRGVRKFRITGGEPFLHKDLGTIVRMLTKFEDVSVFVNTNAFSIIDRQQIISDPPQNFSIVASLDTLDPEQFHRSTGVNARLNKVVQNITTLANIGLLKRLNMVFTKETSDQFPKLLAFCKELGCGLKISDVATALEMNKSHLDIFETIDDIEQYLQNNCIDRKVHLYSKYYGIPQNIYLIDGVWVTVKNSKRGAKYQLNDVCANCRFYPCEEGLYFIYAFPDLTYSGCRQKGYVVSSQSIEEGFKQMSNILLDLSHRQPMQAERIKSQCIGLED